MSSMSTQTDRIATKIAQMNRHKVQKEILHFRGRFKLDFTKAYLESLSVDKLRHILLAAAMQRLRSN